MKDPVYNAKKNLNLRGSVLNLDTPLVMGIVNLTPDSFYDGGAYSSDKALLKKVEQHLSEGADIVDAGGYSSRPGATGISVKEELNRVVKAISKIVTAFPGINISIDTFRSEVARAAVDSGACMVNDISGGNLDPAMFDTIAQLQVPYVLMHMRGTPQNMQQYTTYGNLLAEMTGYFHAKVHLLTGKGVKDIILDPGFGFAKTLGQNYEILKNLSYFKVLGQPVMIGLSRKSMIYKMLDIDVSEALNGTTALHMAGLINGASILRVHDVKEANEVIQLFSQIFDKDDQLC